MTSQVLVSTLTNYVIRRTAANTYLVSLDAATFGRPDIDVCMVHPAAYSQPNRVIAIPYNGSADQLWFSIDGGVTWTQRTDDGYFDLTSYKTDLYYMKSVEDNGDIWGTFFDGMANYYLYKSIDNGQTFTQQIDISSLGALSNFDKCLYISDGWIWCLASGDHLERVATDGTNYDSWAITGFPSGHPGTLNALVGWPTTQRLTAWRYYEYYEILSIDITNPSAPSFTWAPQLVAS